MIKVLVVDDDKLARKGIISLIHEGNYNMQVVGDVQNGRVALEFLEKEMVDLIFVDIDMPEMTGLELMHICKERFPKIKFVVLTFYEEFNYIQQALRLGALDYISKLRMEQEDCDNLFKRITTLLDGKSGEEIKAVEEVKPEITEEEWKSITGEWKELYWIYDEDVYFNLCTRMKKINIGIRKMEHLIIRLIQTIELETGKESTIIPLFREEKDLFDWLTGWRMELYQWAKNQERLDRITICIMKSIVYIKEHMDVPLHTEEVASLVGMSRSYFSVNFKRLTGRNYHDFVRSERMKHAKKLLLETNKGINEIAAAVGFEDVNYFNRVFFEEVKLTPNQYRKNCFL